MLKSVDGEANIKNAIFQIVHNSDDSHEMTQAKLGL